MIPEFKASLRVFSVVELEQCIDWSENGRSANRTPENVLLEQFKTFQSRKLVAKLRKTTTSDIHPQFNRIFGPVSILEANITSHCVCVHILCFEFFLSGALVWWWYEGLYSSDKQPLRPSFLIAFVSAEIIDILFSARISINELCRQRGTVRPLARIRTCRNWIVQRFPVSFCSQDPKCDFTQWCISTKRCCH